ncbi:MAG TPA: hypothetical protein VHK26_07685 [Methyloceanibacter sp.]|jgi:predicted DNA-binding transcriptional regulator AlpA|nr:hypothetical protein [Methyloceanibacter sp.]
MIEADDMITIKETCAIIGGEKRPIHYATYYRGVARGIYPPPIRISPGLVRVSKRAVLETITRMLGRAA